MIESGTILQDRFLVEKQIGVGGMGAVYLATDQKFGTPVAIKETFYNDPALAEAFEREARLLNGLHHPLFPYVSDHFVEGNGHFLVMEYIEGEDLSALLKRGERFPVETVIKWTLDLLDGLDYLHSQDPPIIHRDVKPSNLRLTSRGNLVLLDFGMAKETSGNTQGMRSVFGYSRRYSPLEQIEGTGTDVRSDIFSLGASVYHLLTGSAPVDVLARASAIVVGKPDPLRLASEVNAEIPEALAALVHSAMALDPNKRFVSARAMWNAVEESLLDDERADQMNANDDAATGEVQEASGRIEIPVMGEFDPDGNAQDPGSVGQRRMESGDERLPREYIISPEDAGYSTTNRAYRNRRLLWLPAILLLLGLVTFGLYRNKSNADSTNVSAPEQPASAEQTSPVDQNAAGNGSSGLEPIGPGEEEASSAAGQDLTPETEKAKVAQPDEPNPSIAEKRPEREQNVDPKSPKVRSDAETSAGAGPRADLPNKARTGKATRPRLAESGPGEPPVSSIESVLSGLPDRSRQQLQWDIWREEEQLRRQRRIRRQMRQNRQRYPY